MEIKLAHLYPDILNLSADKGNILALRSRCEGRNIDFSVTEYGLNDEIDLQNTDILLLGGGCEKDKITVSDKLKEIKEKIAQYISDGGVILAVASSYPIIGKTFEAEGGIHEGLGLVNIKTVYDKTRKIGNVVLESELLNHTIVGFENHTDKTEYCDDVCCLGRIIHGTDSEKNEGILTENIIGTHLHGPILPKNPVLTDYIIRQALKKQGENAELTNIDSSYEEKAHNYVLNMFK